MNVQVVGSSHGLIFGVFAVQILVVLGEICNIFFLIELALRLWCILACKCVQNPSRRYVSLRFSFHSGTNWSDTGYKLTFFCGEEQGAAAIIFFALMSLKMSNEFVQQ